ncbi:Ribosomal RNA small subunit methyltransferase A [Stanieria cyanosphaera PCC 7437]|uniref:Ribosomal RNA small subunit methyltransferase A n=1 Tax=Stanieria cyanosphaera (strain ATCC 29371 / PCC 7437) TaxID=111780 RepID=K9XXP6_STAC7|nr:16S rRNA (adenine(1518)-N(6)/adenine(1519)-N(6))-dimethyltransferase RsmA [Stanieria cyanosphaera]AFZ36437.1 Ribosomal RNA small subunit methyltransferase A [Stanieria cyanosphaera PCC 7437]
MTVNKSTQSRSQFRPNKRFGQHWLRSEIALNQIVAAAQLTSSDRILEIGPGTGILTRRLLPLVESLVAVEIDRNLCQKLTQKLGKEDNFLLLQGDFLKLNLTELLESFPSFQQPNKIVANIPYNITGPILEKLLGKISQPATTAYQSIVLLVQQEVGERLTASPGTKAYGALSLRVQYLASCELIYHVPAKAFSPPPKVDSVVIRLHPRTISEPADNPRLLDSLIKLGFANRRKMLRNNLSSVIAPDDLIQLLEQLNLNSQSRAENLSLEDWIKLSNLIGCRSI